MLSARKVPDDRRALVETEGLMATLIVDESLRPDLLDREVLPNSARRVAMFHAFDPSFHNGCNYLGVTAALTGALVPPPEYGEPASAPPLLVNALTGFAPVLATQILPEPSIAMLAGVLRPLPE
jgi:hypothetical protein